MRLTAQAPVLPVPTEDQMRSVAHNSTFQLYQFVRYLMFTKNGERTDFIRNICKIGNPPDLCFKNQAQLKRMGLGLKCINIRNVVNVDGKIFNRVIGTWHLSIEDQELWDSMGIKAQAANDPTS